TAQSGFPLRFGTAANLTNSFGGGSRPNVVAGCDPQLSRSAQSRLNRGVHTSCYALPAGLSFCTPRRVPPQLRAPRINNFDFALFKRTKLTERIGLEFRSEFFNLFNRVQFGFPGQALGNPQFGIVSSQLNNPRLAQFALRLIF